MLLVLPILFAVGFAQRPSTASTCDYYAQQMFGANNSATQFNLIQHIVTLAFNGGSGLSNASSTMTGIFNQGEFLNQHIDLRAFFDGSKASTNLNNQAVGVNWLDGGGADPLNAFLNGTTANVTLDNSSNQFRLFQHFFAAFSHLYGCSNQYIPASSAKSSGGQLSLSYVHKFMDLNYTQIAHFVDQFSQASVFYGFDAQDGDVMSSHLNSLYNIRCAPPVNNQLLSLCLDNSCPLAPTPDCSDYVDLSADGLGNNTVSAQSVPPVPSTTDAVASSTTPSPSPGVSAVSSSYTGLGAGAIAGIAIGAVALLLIGAGIIAFLYHRRRRPTMQAFPTPGYASPSYQASSYGAPSSSSYVTPSYRGPPSSTADHFSPYHTSLQHSAPWNQASSQQPPPWNVHPPIAEMDAPSYEMSGTPEMIFHGKHIVESPILPKR